jgi:hypothetical protein
MFRLPQDRCILQQNFYSSTVTPMDLAVPAIMLMAASNDAAFKSGIFISAIS